MTLAWNSAGSRPAPIWFNSNIIIASALCSSTPSLRQIRLAAFTRKARRCHRRRIPTKHRRVAACGLQVTEPINLDELHEDSPPPPSPSAMNRSARGRIRRPGGTFANLLQAIQPSALSDPNSAMAVGESSKASRPGGLKREQKRWTIGGAGTQTSPSFPPACPARPNHALSFPLCDPLDDECLPEYYVSLIWNNLECHE